MIDTEGEPGLAGPMQYDFRDVYGSVLPDWQTADERKNRGFAIERSEDGRNFTFIAWQATLAPLRETRQIRVR